MRSKITLAGHPLHPMIIGFPIAFYTATAVAFIAYQINGNPFWFRVGYAANIAAVATALLAAIPGFLDWILITQKGSHARRTGMVHMLLNAGAILCFAINLWLQAGKWDLVLPIANGSVFFPVLGLLLAGSAGFQGWNLVQRHHLGIEESHHEGHEGQVETVEDYREQRKIS